MAFRRPKPHQLNHGLFQDVCVSLCLLVFFRHRLQMLPRRLARDPGSAGQIAGRRRVARLQLEQKLVECRPRCAS